MHEKDIENIRKQIELLIKYNNKHREDDIEQVRKNVQTIAEICCMMGEV